VGYEEYTGPTTAGAGTAYALHADRQGSIIAVTDQATGSVAARYSYDAFGERTQTIALASQDYGFTGREYDAETGLYYFRARHYDPELGRFLQSDPLGFAAGDLNLYAYTWNDSANWSDPSGLAASGDAAGLLAKTTSFAASAIEVGYGAMCVANKISTALSSIAALMDGTFDTSNIVLIAGATVSCRTKAKAPKRRNCGCGGGGRGGKNSFPVGTEVLTPAGKVAIETLREGDMVVARNEDSGVSGIFPVTGISQRQATDMLWLTLERGDGSTSRMGVTAAHPLFTVGEGWITAGELVPGDAIRDSTLRELIILAVEIDESPQFAYNLEIAEAHTYFAGELETWGHNARLNFSKLFGTRKGAKDTAGRHCGPIPPGLTGRQLKRLLSGRKADGPDAYGSGGHFHDKDHNSRCKPNVHYRFPKK